MTGCLNPTPDASRFRFGDGRPVRPQPLELPYLLFTAPGRKKPIAYPNLPALARAIQRRRAGRGIDTANRTLFLHGETTGRLTVAIWVQTPDGERGEFLGYAWLDGADRETLQAAIYAPHAARAHRRARAA